MEDKERIDSEVDLCNLLLGCQEMLKETKELPLDDPALLQAKILMLKASIGVALFTAEMMFFDQKKEEEQNTPPVQ